MAEQFKLPSFPEGLTPDWLTDALSNAGFLPDGVAISSARQEQVGDGTGMMSELARLQLSYDGGGQDLPASLIAKFASRNPQNREVAQSYNLYERETRYFAELDPKTTAVSPKAWVSDYDGDNFVILMDDLARYRVGDQAAGADLADSQLMVAELAKLHATFWDAVDHLEWVPHIAHSYHADNMDALVKIGWPTMTETFADYIDPGIVAKGDAFIDALPRLQEMMDMEPVTLLHGDFRMENVLFGTEPGHHPVAIIDWQGPLLGKGIVDVALILGQSTRTAVRREHERTLVRSYAEQLGELGVAAYRPEQAWQDYELALLYNWVYVGVVAGTLDTSNAKAFAWMAQMVARQSAATLDLDLFRLLP